jgi:nuclear pore complex protein Nup133
MFAQDDVQSAYMDKFFAAHPNPSISWVHDLGQRRYEDSASALLSESEHATQLETKHV